MTRKREGRSMDIATPSDVEIVITRAFDAPRAVVWDAWTKPEHVSKWLLGPPGWTMPVCEIDLRAGGTWRYMWRKDDGGAEDFGMHGEYLEVEAPERVVFTERWGAELPPTHNTVAFTESDGVTTTTMTIVYASKDLRDMALNSGMTGGIATSYERLDEQLAALR